MTENLHEVHLEIKVGVPGIILQFKEHQVILQMKIKMNLLDYQQYQGNGNILDEYVMH